MTQFGIDFPTKKFRDWKHKQQQRLRGNFQHAGREGERHYVELGIRYKQLALINFLDVPHSELNS